MILGFLLFLGATGGGGYYYFVYRPAHAPGASPPLVVAPPRDSSGGITDSAIARGASGLSDSALRADSLAHRTPVSTALPSGAAPAAPVRDSGSLLIKGLPGGSAVFVDSRQVITSPAKVAIGQHDLLITPPMGYQSIQSKIQIVKGQTLTLTPVLSRVGQGSAAPAAPKQAAAKGQCDTPGVVTYNLDNLCWDSGPRAMSPSTFAFSNGGASPSSLWVRVAADGSVLEVRPARPSDDDAFERVAEAYARTMKFATAVKDGAAVDGWRQVRLTPTQQ
jgi:hypothetical protein